MLNYRRLVVGELATNCYLLWSTDKSAVIIDPGDEGTEIAQVINELQLKPMMILLTHGHFDHILGVIDLKLIYNIPIAMGKEDAFLVDRAGETAKYFLKRDIKIPKIKKIDNSLKEIRTIKMDDDTIEVIKCPGHTPGGVSFYAPKSKLLFTGDTVFAGGLRGETGHKYSSKKLLYRSICSLLKLPDETVVLPGHGEETNLAEAKRMFNCNYCELP
ncbi:MAG: MBL fold metallo-hydrolase [Patescibacteria group bacterium]